MPNGNSIVPGVAGVNPQNKRLENSNYNSRYIEDIIIHKEEAEEIRKKFSPPGALCESAVLPKGTTCEGRIKDKSNGFYFCTAGKENCPFSKERA